ncbi:MAG: hypothetical protein O2905_01425 [Proteobacteria bacterium]|nr:hypothetical protein [Pseudomonadota bacterium]
MLIAHVLEKFDRNIGSLGKVAGVFAGLPVPLVGGRPIIDIRIPAPWGRRVP